MTATTFDPRPIALDTGVTLHVVEHGDRGAPPVVFVHGGGKNWKQWARQLEPFAAAGFRAIAYSRRYAEPNDDPGPDPTYDAHVDAADLAAIVAALGLGAVHLVGASIGGVACLLHAIDHPEAVRSLVLGEPPIMRWAPALPGGQEAVDAFDRDAWLPARGAFRRGERERAMGLLIDGFLGRGAWAAMPDAQRRGIMRGARDWEAQVLSETPFADVPKERLRALRQPVLLLGGERTIPAHAIVDAELARLLPHARRVIVPGATHDMWADRPDECRRHALELLAST